MSANVLARSVRQIELFQGLSPLQITEVARRAERKIFRPGEAIITAGSPADCAVLVVSGDAKRVRGPDLEDVDEPLPVGTLLGEMAMLIETEHTSTVVAVSSVRALCITRAELQAQMGEDPALAEHFVGRISERLAALAAEMREIEGALATQRQGLVASHFVDPSGGPTKAGQSAAAAFLH